MGKAKVQRNAIEKGKNYSCKWKLTLRNDESSPKIQEPFI